MDIPDPLTSTLLPQVGVVIIGRNEGERLVRCVKSALAEGVQAVMYVDSGSTDGSSEKAGGLGATVISLERGICFTASRARNVGFDAMLGTNPSLELVQFVDGDCELVDGWLARAAAELARRPDAAIVCGRRRERCGDASVYNRLCDIEWDTPVGEAKSCGGDAMMRCAAFKAIGGFNPDLIAGEEPELCVRLRAMGAKVLRIDAEMTLHDAAMTRFSQWWRRSVRAGHAYAEGAALHGGSPERLWIKEVCSNVFWGLVIPILALSMAWLTRGFSLLLLVGYAVLFLRIRRYKVRMGASRSDASLYALFTILGKCPQMVGQMRYWVGRVSGRRSVVIEYKTANPLSATRGATPQRKENHR